MKLKIMVLLLGLFFFHTMCQAQAPTKMYWTEYYPTPTSRWAGRSDLNGQNQQQLCQNQYGYEGIEVDFQNSKIYLVASHQGKIQRANLDGSNVEDIITSIHPVDITLDLSGGKIYWTDYTYSNAVIKRANLDGSGVETITAHLGNGCDLQGITIDVPGGKVYWVERMDDVICRCNLDGSGKQTILHCYDGVSNSWDVAIYGSKLYWTDALLSTDNISRANLDGSSVENDIITGLNHPRGIAIDHTTGKIYWVSSGDNCIKRADIDGSNLETLVTGLSHPYGISLNYNQNTLPVELTEFTAVYSNDNSGNECVMVTWETASETDVLGFNIYRSEQNDIITVGSSINSNLLNAVGNSTQTNEYSFDDIDAHILKPYFYWLEVVNLDGTTELHGSIVYTPGDINGDNSQDVYMQNILGNSHPNPASVTTKISYQIKGSVTSQNAEIRVYNILGELVKTVSGTCGHAILDVSDLSNGIYFYALQTVNSYDLEKFIVLK